MKIELFRNVGKGKDLRRLERNKETCPKKRGFYTSSEKQHCLEKSMSKVELSALK